tara:strand:+ start:390 stop:830 length:441 start_codon:yes stop_codon:yes gene_type:complete
MSYNTTCFTVQLTANGKLLVRGIGFNKDTLKGFKWDKTQQGYLIKDTDSFDIVGVYNSLNNEDSDSSESCETQTNGLFNNMEYFKYGKGYILKPTIKNHPDYGYKGNYTSDYYHGGWWRNDLNGWFFRGSKHDLLQESNATYTQKK